MTPIMYAVRTQKTRLVNFLLEKKADVKVVDGRGCSVLYFAVSEGAANSPTYVVLLQSFFFLRVCACV